MLEKTRDFFSIGQSFCTIAGIITAGIWFLLQSQCGPKLQIEHRVSHRQSALDSTKDLVGIDVILKNVGNVEVNLSCGHLRVLDVNPGKARLVWPTDLKDQNQACLETMLIEPNEGDEVHKELLVDRSVKTIRVRSFFRNPRAKDDVGWELTTLYDLDTPPSGATTGQTSAPHATPGSSAPQHPGRN